MDGSSACLVSCVESHLDRLLNEGTDRHGATPTAMWMANLDTRTGALPPAGHTPGRVYRLIGAPNGVTCYWDQPSLAAARVLARVTGKAAYADAADAYVRDFIARCSAADGVLQWGNHAYYDAASGAVVPFSGGYHELRPITPDWDSLAAVDGAACERYLRTVLPRHLHSPETGGFNRHDDRRRSCAFLESGGILVESLAWLHRRTGEAAYQELARRVASYSFSHRGERTGLLVNNPDQGRWDSLVCTTEVGLWGLSLLRAAALGADPLLAGMAREAVRAYLIHGYDSATGDYFGQLAVADGRPVTPATAGYWPRRHAAIWNVDQWPTHDYPMALAEAALALYRLCGEGVFLEAVQRWVRVVRRGLPARGGQGAYAGHYGACIHFLTAAGRQLGDPGCLDAARCVAGEAVGGLRENGMFQGFPGTHLYEAVDGVGGLLLALLYLETGADSVCSPAAF